MDFYEINIDTLCIIPIDEKTSFIYETPNIAYESFEADIIEKLTAEGY